MQREHLWIIVASAYLVMSLAAFVAFYRDKRAARRGTWRTPEKVLLALGLLGGWPGAILGMNLLRHKTHKWTFKLGLPLIAAAHIAAWIALVLLLFNDAISNS